MGRIVIREGDISEQEVDAIVNAANTELVLGSGVAGAIRDKGGPTIQQECATIGPIELGSAALTAAGELPARYVIHAAAMHPGGSASESSVQTAIRRSFEIAREQACRSIAVPALGAGVGGLAAQRCAEVILAEARDHLASETTLEEIRIVLFGEPVYRIFEAANDAAKIEAQMAKLRARK